MAGISYQCDYTSLNGWEYRLQIWDRNQSGNPANDFNISDMGVQIKYDSKGGESKINPIMCSKITFEFMVETSVQESYITSNIRPNTIQEKDIYFFLYRKKGLGYDLVWSGFLISDLDTTEDIARPYAIKFEAIDGIALLKDVPFVKDALNQGAGPFTRAQTYAGYSNGAWNDGWISAVQNKKYKRVIEFLTESIQYAQFGGMSNNYSTIGAPEISSSANWWNGQHLASYIGTQDPLYLTRMNAEQFYKLRENSDEGSTNYYDAMSCYDALATMCRCWGLRCLYWEGTIYFIQIGLYNTSETGTSTDTTNITTKIYDIFANPQSGMRDHVGNNGLSRYQIDLNSDSQTGKVQKLAGTKWNEYPPIKKVVTSFPSISNDNRFNGFPLTYGTDDSPHTWPTAAMGPTAQTHDLFTLTDFASLDGIYIDLHLQFTSTASVNSYMQLFWAIQAKPTNQTDWVQYGLFANYKPSTQEIVWEPTNTDSTLYYVGGTQEINFTDSNYNGTTNSSTTRYHLFGSPGMGNSRYHMITVPPGNSALNITDGTYINTNCQNVLTPDSTMTGDWDFRIVTLNKTSNTNTSNNSSNGYEWGHMVGYQNWGYAWPEIPWDGLFATGQARWGYPNSQIMNGDIYYTTVNSATYPSIVALVSGGAIGSVGFSTELYTANNDSYVLEIDDTLWGDCQNDDSPGSLRVYDGSNWVYTNFVGEWAKNSTSGDLSLTELMCEEALFLQNTPSYMGNYHFVVSKLNKNFNNDDDYPRFISPITRIKDTIQGNRKYVPLQITIDTVKNEVKGKYFEMKYNTVTRTSSSTSIGTVGGLNDPTPF